MGSFIYILTVVIIDDKGLPDLLRFNILCYMLGDSDRPATMNDLKEMRYLECCIKVIYQVYMILRILDNDTWY